LDARAELYVRENGKTLAEAKGELLGVVSRQRGVLTYGQQLDDVVCMATPTGGARVIWRPFGVVVSIVPWNGPVSVGFTQSVAALLAGNAVVVKPPESCPLALSRTLDLFVSQLPPGL